MINRRQFLKTAAVGIAAGGSIFERQQVWAAEQASGARVPAIKVTGYDYDRVRAIMDERVGIEGTEVSFDTNDIYGVTRHAFGPDKKYEVTEIGLIPFLRKYINEGFRDYTLVPVFISRTFRHRNIFVHVDVPSGIGTFLYMLIRELKSPRIYAAE
jgi:4,5-dihydroxyphthalate decarboxylase